MDAAARLKGDRNRRESAGAGEASSLDSRGQERLGVRVRLLHISAVGGGGMQSSVAASQLLDRVWCFRLDVCSAYSSPTTHLRIRMGEAR
jgi:hypothetical protein